MGVVRTVGIAALAASAQFGTAGAQPFTHSKNLCIEDKFAPKAPALFALEPFKFVVGCELIDCCPGCPAGAPIDLEIKFSGTGIKNAELRLSAAPDSSRPRRLAKGTTRLKGVPASAREKLVTAELRFAPDLESLKKAARRTAPDQWRELGAARVDVAQTILGYAVQENRITLAFHHCGHSLPKPRQDEIRLRRLADRQVAVTLIDARQYLEFLSTGQPPMGGFVCTNDWPVRNSGLAGVGNLVDRQGCNSEVSVFSRDDAFHFAGNVTSWTAGRETLELRLDPPITVPLTVWIVVPGTRAKAEADVAESNRVFAEYRAGFQLRATYVEDPNLAANWPPAGQVCADLRNGAFFAANQLNAYYVEEIGGVAVGFHCANGPILVDADDSGLRTLAHEIGHAMRLSPTNADHYSEANSGDPNPIANLMFFADGHGELTLGQAFRMNMEPASELNTLGLRSGAIRSCPASGSEAVNGTVFCPRLGLRLPDTP